MVWDPSDCPCQVFQALFEFLEENWSKLSPGVVKALKDKPLVPVGARLIKAARLFFRLKVCITVPSTLEFLERDL